MRRISMALWMALTLALVSSAAVRADEAKRPLIQIAILLDTSGSMSGLIGQAKSQLWKIVNEFAMAKRGDVRADLRVALYEYGNNGLSAKEGYIRMILPLTTDLDKVSEELFALKTNGGSEYCGWVIKDATDQLLWSRSNEDMKAIFIAGNEPFTQGNVDYRKACKAAITKGIVVNTIFCGPHETGVRTQWKDGAVLADGTYINIDQDRRTVHIEAPQDKEIARLGAELNKTYVRFGTLGKAGAKRQEAQDENAYVLAGTGACVQRAVSKASGQYRNYAWDLVDALKEGKVKLEDVKDKDLPEEMRKMSLKERRAYVEAKLKERQKMQERISELNDACKKFVAEKMKQLSEKGEDTFDVALIKALREQAEKKSFELK